MHMQNNAVKMCLQKLLSLLEQAVAAGGQMHSKLGAERSPNKPTSSFMCIAYSLFLPSGHRWCNQGAGRQF
jgi:hypothetical protein